MKVCGLCYCSPRKYLHGVLNPDSTVGLAVLTETVVSSVLQDCIKCNIVGSFNSPYDLISDQYGTINVKSSTLRESNTWQFNKRDNQTIPDYYICIGLDEFRFNVLKVFIIPGNSNLVTSGGISITNTTRGLVRSKEYMVNEIPYNEIYQSLTINELPEFKNYNSPNKYIPPTKLADTGWYN